MKKIRFTLQILLDSFEIHCSALNIKRKNKQSYKPGSVTRPKARPLSFLWDRRRRRPQATYPQQRPKSETGRLDCCLFGLSTPEVYQHIRCRMRRGLLPRVFTLTLQARRFVFCGTGCRSLVTEKAPSC